MAGNAIADRLDLLHDQWNEFATDADARLLRWLVREDEYRMIEAFVQTEQDEVAGDIPDLFLRFVAPFEDVDSYGAALRESLVEQYEVAREEIRAGQAEEEAGAGAPGEAGEAEGAGEGDAGSTVGAPVDDLELTWSAPPVDDRHSLIAFLEASESLQAHHSDMMEKLALILTPETISDVGDWERWLKAFAERLPDTVRAAVVDSAEAPELDALAEALPKRVMTVPADLDMPAAVAELARSGGTSTPDGRFRVHFTAMLQSLGEGDFDGAHHHGAAAEAVATENGWKHLVGAVHMALAGGYLGAQRHDEAIRHYRQVDRVGAEIEAEAEQGEEEEAPARQAESTGGSVGAEDGRGEEHGKAEEADGDVGAADAGSAGEGETAQGPQPATDAEVSPEEAMVEADVGPKLRMQAGMGAGAAFLMAGDFQNAAATYTATAPHARHADDTLMVLESWRMAGYCHERLGDTARAWECGLKALDAGEEMDESDRANSTLPHAGDGLMRLVEHSPDHARIIDERLTALLGTPDWRAAASNPPDFT
ncbi:MAG: hypothetical protein PVI57_00470 [Gemmatimonadota bacterium]|jgi:hypothetical protein